MSKDPIEELFRDNRHGLDEQPRGLLWDKIEEKLEEKPKVSKNNWWKYGIAASVVAGLSFAAYFFLFDSSSVPAGKEETQIAYEPKEITEENASEMLDKLEEQKQSVVTTQKAKQPPEIIKNDIVSEMEIASPEIYDLPPAPAYEAAKISIPEEQILEKQEADASIVFRGDSPQKKSKNYITQKDLDERRMGNMSTSDFSYDTIAVQQLQVQTNKHLINYEIISQTENQITFENGNIAYPSQIIFQESGDSIQVIYKGNDSKKNSKESKAIQKYIKENKENILTGFGLN